MIDSLERATRILDLFSSDIPEWTVSEVGRALDLPKTTVWEYMQAMVGLGMLRRSGRGRYRLGWRAYQLGLRARMTSEISGPARTEIARLVEEFDETVQLSSRYGREVVYLEKKAPRTGVQVSLTRVSERVPAHCTAAGKLLLAHLTSGELDNLFGDEPLRTLTPHSVKALQELKPALPPIRERGYAIDSEESVEGMCCVAAPVRNADGDITWALSMSFLEYRLPTHGERYAHAVVDAAERLSLASRAAVDP